MLVRLVVITLMCAAGAAACDPPQRTVSKEQQEAMCEVDAQKAGGPPVGTNDEDGREGYIGRLTERCMLANNHPFSHDICKQLTPTGSAAYLVFTDPNCYK